MKDEKYHIGMVEIPLDNGKSVVNDWYSDKIYDIGEWNEKHIHFSLKFPFIRVEKVKYAKFTYQSMYETMRDAFDDTYYTKYTLPQLFRAFGLKYTQKEKIIMEETLENGE